MKMLMCAVLAVGTALLSGSVDAQTGQAAPAPVVAPVDTEKQISTMEAKLADWPQLGRYKDENAAPRRLGQMSCGWCFMGTQLRMGGEGGGTPASSFRESRT